MSELEIELGESIFGKLQLALLGLDSCRYFGEDVIRISAPLYKCCFPWKTTDLVQSIMIIMKVGAPRGILFGSLFLSVRRSDRKDVLVLRRALEAKQKCG